MAEVKNFIFWTPRILSILFLLFLALFSLDVFDSSSGFWSAYLGLIMHNIPVFVLAILLWISWKRELVGAVTFGLAGIAYIALLVISAVRNSAFEWYMLSWSLTIAGPAFFIAFLFYLGWKRKQANKGNEKGRIMAKISKK